MSDRPIPLSAVFPTVDIEQNNATDFIDLSNSAGRLMALESALRITRETVFNEDAGSVIDFAEYIRTGRRGLPLEECNHITSKAFRS